MAGAQRVLILGVDPNSLLNFRKTLIETLVLNGHEVIVAAQKASTKQKAIIESLGAKFREAKFSRAGMNPFKDIVTIRSLTILFRAEKPDVVLAYTPKPVIYGAIAARMASVPRFVAMITGLGYSFIEGQGARRYVARNVTTQLYRSALPKCTCVIFQNTDDQAHFEKLGLLKSVQKVGVVNGSGVDVAQFAVAKLPPKPVFLMIARLLIDKGIYEYVSAAAQLRAKLPQVRTLLVGGLDPSPNSVDADEMQKWSDAGLEYLGHLDDVRPAICDANVVVLPSYREGTPRSVLEGMAMGRAIITTDVPGCRQTVIHGENGLLVRARDSQALFEAMMILAMDAKKVADMGRASRRIAVEKYEAGAVAKDIIKLAGINL